MTHQSDIKTAESEASLRQVETGQPNDQRRRRADGKSVPSSFTRELLWFYITFAGSLLLRFSVLDFESGDYKGFLSNWYEFLIEHGRWHGLGMKFANYPPLYLYLLSLSTLLPVRDLYAIKSITLVFDYVAAYFVWRLIRRQYPSGKSSWLALTVLLFLPTVFLNGAVWGQCDIIYTSGFLASLFYILEERPMAALVAFGFSCSLKPQAIYWVPFVAGLLISGRLPWRRVWIPAAVYGLCGIPQMLAGMPVLRTVGHWALVRNRPGLAQGVPNWYQWVFESDRDVFYWLGVVLTLCATVSFVLWMREAPRTVANRSRWLVSLALLSVLFPPFLLPGMHERYFFAADVISVVYAFYVPRGWRVTVLIQVASAFAYIPYLFEYTPIPMTVLPLAILAAMALLLRDLVHFRSTAELESET